MSYSMASRGGPEAGGPNWRPERNGLGKTVVQVPEEDTPEPDFVEEKQRCWGP